MPDHDQATGRSTQKVEPLPSSEVNRASQCGEILFCWGDFREIRNGKPFLGLDQYYA